MHMQALKQKRNDVLRIAAKHGARNVRVIGSVARNEEEPDSDLDLLVQIESGRTLLDRAALIVELEELLGCKVEVASDRGLRKRLREQILQEAVPV